MPYLQDSRLDFGLENLNSNMEKLQYFLTKELLVIFEENEFILYREGENNGTIFLVDTEENEIIYLIDFETNHSEILGRTVTQVVLWRSLTSRYENITKKVFFNYLLENFGCVVSDSAQTERGKDFWIRQMSLAANKGFSVGIIDSDRLAKTFDRSNGKFRHWLEDQNGWGDEMEYFSKRFFIKKK